ncbi:hypothetical protein [Roseomonas elaeocarpi]|uniref:Uncharacterized protein n=1 Tax=Roseomonas elaeocarpi TaxID=907779 RepID=A0ABV6JTG7_9PROT
MPATLGSFTRFRLDTAAQQVAPDDVLGRAGIAMAFYRQDTSNIFGILMLDPPSAPPLPDGVTAPDLLFRKEGMWRAVPRRPNMHPLTQFDVNDAPSKLRLSCFGFIQQEPVLLLQVATCLTAMEGRMVVLSMGMPVIPDAEPRAAAQALTSRAVILLTALRENLQRDPRVGLPNGPAAGRPPIAPASGRPPLRT